MKMNKKKTLFGLFPLIATCVIAFSSVGATVTAIAAAVTLTKLPDYNFQFSPDANRTFNCRNLGDTNNIAISWGKKPSEAPTGTLVIPATFTYQGTDYTVTQIEDGGFRGCKNLKEIYISDNIDSIVDGAFSECNSIAFN